jgi:hypothetical protein
MTLPLTSESGTRTVLATAVDAIRILSPHEFIVGTQRVAVPPQANPATGGSLSPEENMIRALQAQLYASVYNRRFEVDAVPAAPATFTDMADELSRANPGRERWDHGWQVYDTQPNGMIQAHKQGRAQMFYPGQYMMLGGTMPHGASVANGAVVSVYLAKEMRNFQPGFYLVLGENVQPYYEQASLVRVYWNISPDGAVPIVGELVARFNRFQVPFRFKCLSFRELYDRYDSGVLFVGRRQWDIAALLVAELYRSIRRHLRPDTPLFTKRLAPGLALAEDPGDGESFGTSRCRLVAEGLWAAHQRGAQRSDERLEAIADAFARAGLSRERPWLNSGSIDHYDVRLD